MLEKKSRTRLYAAIVVITALLVTGGAWYFGFIPGLASSSTVTPNDSNDVTKEAVEKETGDLVVEVGALIMLPVGEVPTVATVSDPRKLQDQVFFKDAEVGDKVLLYTKSRKAYLYRPSLHLLIEVAPITTDVQ